MSGHLHDPPVNFAPLKQISLQPRYSMPSSQYLSSHPVSLRHRHLVWSFRHCVPPPQVCEHLHHRPCEGPHDPHDVVCKPGQRGRHRLALFSQFYFIVLGFGSYFLSLISLVDWQIVTNKLPRVFSFSTMQVINIFDLN